VTVAVSLENTAGALRKEDAFDVAAVDRVLKESISGLTGAPSVSQFQSGSSNLTFLLSYPDRDLVLRRPPTGTRPKSGHSMIREYSVVKALKPVFPTVPEVLYYADHESSVIGAEFYVMERVNGLLLNTDIPADWGWTPDDTRRFCEGFWDKLAELHAVDYTAIGLGDFGKPKGYVARQIGGWNARYEKALTEDADRLEDVRDWLEANQPPTESAHTIVHGDFRIDNCILDADDPFKINAILDWEISALGDPLMDLGATLVYWVEANDPPEMRALKKQPSDAPGMMTRKEAVAYYAAKSGRTIEDITFYYVYGVFRLAAIAQQIYYRYFHKETTNPAYAVFGPGARGLGSYARQLIRDGAT